MKDLFEMSNIRKKDTGLPVNIWLDDIGSERNVKHNLPRLKIQGNYKDRVSSKTELISVSISDDPQVLVKRPNLEISSSDLKEVLEFIKVHKDTLLGHWNGDLSTSDVLAIFKDHSDEALKDSIRAALSKKSIKESNDP